MKYRFSFIVPSYNSFLTIKETVNSILAQTEYYSIAEVIVVDSSDDQKTREVLSKFDDPKLKIIYLDQKTNPALTRNRGAEEATGDVFAFVDSDAWIAPDWQKEINQAFSEGRRVGGGRVCLPSSQRGHCLATAQLYLQFNEFIQVGLPQERKIVPSVNIYCDRELFQQTGGFPNIRASEDVLFCLSFESVEKIWLIPQARCFHNFREDWQSFKSNQILLGKYICLYRKQSFDHWIYKGITPALLLPFFLGIKVTRMVARIWKVGPDHRKSFLGSLNIFLTGLFYWSIGFLKGCFGSQAISEHSNMKEGRLHAKISN